MRPRSTWQLFAKLALAAMALAGFLLLAGAPQARADQEHDCQSRIAHADHQLHDAIEHHGPNSKQADHWRHELNNAREWCWNHYHRWWDEDGHSWHSEHDWDDHDHDHDHDHH